MPAVRRLGGLALAAALFGVAVPDTWAQQPAPPPVSVEVQGYRIEGNTLLPPERMEQRLQAFKGPRTLQQLRDAALAVQELYRQAGYGGVVAYLPEQALQAGEVRIRVVEGRLTRIDVAEGKAFRRANLLASVPSLKTGRTPEVRRIDAEIQMANENPAKSMQVLLEPGADPGTIAARLSVAEQPVQRLTARLDDTGGKQNGRWRAALGWQHANLFDADQVLAAEWQTAPQHPSTVNVVSGSWHVPLYPQALALDAYGAWSDVAAGKVGTQAGELAFAGRGYIAGARTSVYLPRRENLDQRLVVGIEWREYRNTCSIDGLPQDSCGAAGASVVLQPASLTYTAQSVGELRLGFSVGLHANLGLGGRNAADSDFDAVRSGSRRHYLALRSNAQLGLPIEGWGNLALRASAQYSASPLVPGELFGIGGVYSVRGYEERELGGDSGLQFTLEAASPNYSEHFEALRGADLRAIVFTDAGWVANRNDQSCLAGTTNCHLASLGMGLRLNWQQLQLRLDLATALNAGASTRKGSSRAHVGLNFNY